MRAAVRLQLRLEDQGAKLAMGMMGAVGQAAVVCDATGRMVAATPAAEAALQAGDFVTVRQERLACPDPASDVALATAVARRAGRARSNAPPPAGCGCTTLCGAAGSPRRPRRSRPKLPPSASRPRSWCCCSSTHPPAEAQAPRLMRLYGLTAAEAEVALAIACGDAAGTIAERRGVRISTVRSQLAAALAKTGAARQTELVALVLRTAG